MSNKRFGYCTATANGSFVGWRHPITGLDFNEHIRRSEAKAEVRAAARARRSADHRADLNAASARVDSRTNVRTGSTTPRLDALRASLGMTV